MKDNIADMINRLKNGQRAKILTTFLYWPTPKICIKILNILQKEGFILGYKKINLNKKSFILINFKYDLNNEPVIKKMYKISSPGKRYYIQSTSLWKTNTGGGLYILSTPKGILTDLEARYLNVGGEILLYIE